MYEDFSLFPSRGSTTASQVDALYFALIGVTGFYVLLIVVAIVYFAVKYRHGSLADRSRPATHSSLLEAAWIAIPLVQALAIFGWAAKVYYDVTTPPRDAMEIYVSGKQWMWKFEHPEGNREVGELHVPAGRAVRLLMTSRDVIHSLYVPAFRVKMDVLPARFTSVWFEATEPGDYRLFCAEYCGAQHAGMGGKVVVMEPARFEKWLEESPSSGPLAARGIDPFRRLGCVECHVTNAPARAPRLEGIFGRQVRLSNGETVVADESYVRESIVNPRAKIVEGYPPVMPAFPDLSDDDLFPLIDYVKSLGREKEGK